MTEPKLHECFKWRWPSLEDDLKIFEYLKLIFSSTYQNQLPGMPQSALIFSVGGGVGGGPTNYFVTTNSSWCLVWLWQFERNSQTLLLSILRFSKWLKQNWPLWFPVFTVRQLIFLYLKNTNIMFIHLVLTKTFLSRK